jgi:hypothetical protein
MYFLRKNIGALMRIKSDKKFILKGEKDEKRENINNLFYGFWADVVFRQDKRGGANGDGVYVSRASV